MAVSPLAIKRCSASALAARQAHYTVQKRFTANEAHRTLARTSVDGRSAAASTRSSGAAVLVLPGFLFGSRQYEPLVSDLRARGFHADVVPMDLRDWAGVLAGGAFDWYVARTDAMLQSLYVKHGKVALVGHSAGGWVARILLGGKAYQGTTYARNSWVHTLVTLGTPHLSIEAYPFGRIEESLTGMHLEQAPVAVRGSSLKFANHFYPSAADLEGVRVVCACGNAIHGRQLWPLSQRKGSAGAAAAAAGEPPGSAVSRWDEWFAYESYKSGCGRGDVDGDGITPLCIAFLPGAERLELPGVWHSPGGREGRPWYGDAHVLEQWQHLLLAHDAHSSAVQ